MEYVNGVLLSDILTGVRRDRTACVAELRQRGCDPDRVAANIVCNFLNQLTRCMRSDCSTLICTQPIY